MQTNKPKTEAKTLSDLLPYMGVDPLDGALWLKDGSATRSFRMVPKSCLNSTEEDLEVVRSVLVRAFSALPEGVIAQVRMVRTQLSGLKSRAMANWNACHQTEHPEPESESSVGVGQAPAPFGVGREKLFEARSKLTRESEERGALFQTEVYVTLRISPDLKPRSMGKLGALAHLAYFKNPKKIAEKRAKTIIQELDSVTETFRLGLESAGIEILQLTFDEQFLILSHFFNPDRKTKPISHDPNSTCKCDKITMYWKL